MKRRYDTYENNHTGRPKRREPRKARRPTKESKPKNKKSATPARKKEPAARCGAKNRNSDRTCRLPAGWGTDHIGVGYCRRHCGNTPGGKKYAQRLTAEAAVVAFGLPREVDPTTALMEELWRAAGWVAWLQHQVTDHDPGKLVTGRQPQDDIARFYYAQYQRERRHLLEVSKTAIAAGLAERQVRLAEEQAHMMARVFRDALRDLSEQYEGIDTNPEVGRALRRHLVLVSRNESVKNEGGGDGTAATS